jgi:hypothetical protein
LKAGFGTTSIIFPSEDVGKIQPMILKKHINPGIPTMD